MLSQLGPACCPAVGAAWRPKVGGGAPGVLGVGAPGVRGVLMVPGASGPGSREMAADQEGRRSLLLAELQRSSPPSGLTSFPPFIHMVTRPHRTNRWHLQAGSSYPQNA